MPPARVAFVVTGLGVGGAETQLLRLAGELDPRRFEPVVFPLRAGSGIQAAGVRVMPFTPLALRAFRPALVQGWMYHGNLAASLMRPLLPGRPPVLWNVRGLNATQPEPKWTSRLAFRACDKLSRTPRWIVYNSATSALAHERACGYPVDRRVVIPNGFDTERFRPRAGAGSALRQRLGVRESVPLVGLIGRDHPDKDIPNFMRSARAVLDAGVEARFVLAGKGLGESNRDLVALGSTLGLDEHVRFLGPIEDVATFVPELDVLVSASLRESFPNVVGEAMSCGVPCAVTDVGDCALLVDDTGSVAPARDPAALAEAILLVLRLAPVTRAELGARARRRILEHYAMPAIARRYEALYAETLSEAGVPCAA